MGQPLPGRGNLPTDPTARLDQIYMAANNDLDRLIKDAATALAAGTGPEVVASNFGTAGVNTPHDVIASAFATAITRLGIMYNEARGLGPPPLPDITSISDRNPDEVAYGRVEAFINALNQLTLTHGIAVDGAPAAAWLVDVGSDAPAIIADNLRFDHHLARHTCQHPDGAHLWEIPG